ncbi:MAG: helix-turn-helix domain-containing protein, partial [Eubacterium sp.]|nr:helix-turn-helix domain-containing protein [Eubacterium sp.]
MRKEVYDQSTCLVSQIAFQYYIEEKKTSEIVEQFELSPSTVSRVLKRAREEGIIRISLAQPYLECNQMERYLEERF